MLFTSALGFRVSRRPILSQGRAVASGKVTCIYLLSNSAMSGPGPRTPFLSPVTAPSALQEGPSLQNWTWKDTGCL